ncbi:MAG: methyltransferase domain-containing protein [Oligoflexia bacterium]|nr:methyltransferase domain-containing protein [Oligoflexia bacterium]
MSFKNFISCIHNSSKRNYLSRALLEDRALCAEIARKFAKEYWDGDRKFGYGGYNYDGRWHSVAQRMADNYQLQAGQKILDVGCGKGYLLYEFTKIIPGIEVYGIDISKYAIEHALPEVKKNLIVGSAQKLPFSDRNFNFVYSINTLHNLYLFDLKSAINEILRVSNNSSSTYVCVESYQNETEKINLLNWQLTCEAFFCPTEWEWLFKEWKYEGDYEFIFFK